MKNGLFHMRGVRLGIALLLMVTVLVGVLGGANAFASEQFDLDREGSLAVTLLDKETRQPVEGGTLAVYKVADAVTENANLLYESTAEFAGCGLDLRDPADFSANGVASHLLAYANDKGVAPTATAGLVQGVATFEGLSCGAYLVVQTEASEGFFSMTPFVACIPMTSADGTAWVYAVEASPKVEAIPPEPIAPVDLRVVKTWSTPDTALPQSVRVMLQCDGAPYESVELNAHNGWSHTWTELAGDHSWTVSELDVPAGYTASYEVGASQVTITNTKPGAPAGNDKLIQTGQLAWPVPVLAVGGVLVAALGWTLARTGDDGRKHAER